MSNCCDTGLQGSSPRDRRFMQFISDGPGIAGFSMKPDPEEDGDAFAASFDPFLRPENTETCFSEWDDDGRHLSLEALEGLGVEIADHDDEEEDEESAVLRSPWEAERFRADEGIEASRPSGITKKWWMPPRWQRHQKKVDTIVIIDHDAVREEARKAAEAERARKEREVKAATPPVGKYLAGTVVDQGPKGLLVDIGNGVEARVPIALEMGHGSWERAADWILGFKPGTKVRIRVIRVLVNGHAIIEAVLSDRHPRPFWKKEEVSRQVEARPAN